MTVCKLQYEFVWTSANIYLDMYGTCYYKKHLDYLSD